MTPVSIISWYKSGQGGRVSLRSVDLKDKRGRLTVTLTGTLADTGEDRVTTVGLGDVVDELLNQDSLADTGTAEETNLASTGVRGEQVDDLDTGLEDLGRGRLVDVRGRVGVDREGLDGLDRATLVDRLADNVDDTAEATRSDGDLDGRARVDDVLSTDETLGTCCHGRARWSVSEDPRQNPAAAAARGGLTVHGDGADRVLAEVHSDLENETVLKALNLKGVQDGREVLRVELDLHVFNQLGSARCPPSTGSTCRAQALHMVCRL